MNQTLSIWMLYILFSDKWLYNSNLLCRAKYISHNKACSLVYSMMDIPQEVKVDGGELGLNQRPETPEEMRCLDKRGEGEQHKGLACSHCVKVNVVSNYTTQLTQAYTKLAEALWQQHKIADTDIQLLHNCPSSTLPSFPPDSKQGRLWPRGERQASQGLPVVIKLPPIWWPHQQAHRKHLSLR